MRLDPRRILVDFATSRSYSIPGAVATEDLTIGRAHGED
jgi:hypothetical protein